MRADMWRKWDFHTLDGGTDTRAFQKGNLAVTVKIQTQRALWSRGFYSGNLPCASIHNMYTERYGPGHSQFSCLRQRKLPVSRETRYSHLKEYHAAVKKI